MLGWLDKDGSFNVGVRSRVLFLERTTRLKGAIVKEGAYTAIRGYMSEGVPPNQVGVVIVALILVAGIMFANGEAIFSLLIGLVCVGTYIVFVGDHQNSAYMVKELKRVLSAKDKPPVASTASAQSAKPATGKSSAGKATPQPTAGKPTAGKPAPKPSAKPKPTTRKTAKVSP